MRKASTIPVWDRNPGNLYKAWLRWQKNHIGRQTVQFKGRQFSTGFSVKCNLHESLCRNGCKALILKTYAQLAPESPS